MCAQRLFESLLLMVTLPKEFWEAPEASLLCHLWHISDADKMSAIELFFMEQERRAGAVRYLDPGRRRELSRRICRDMNFFEVLVREQFAASELIRRSGGTLGARAAELSRQLARPIKEQLATCRR